MKGAGLKADIKRPSQTKPDKRTIKTIKTTRRTHKTDIPDIRKELAFN